MKRFQIKDNKSALITHAYEAAVAMPHQSEWGKLERIVRGDQVTEEEKLTAIETIVVTLEDGSTETSYRLPQTYSVIETDLTAEINEKKKADYAESRTAQAELDIQAALKASTGQDADYTTHLMHVARQIEIIQNNTGTFTATDITNAKATLDVYRPLFTQIEQIRSQRDADIAAYVP